MIASILFQAVLTETSRVNPPGNTEGLCLKDKPFFAQVAFPRWSRRADTQSSAKQLPSPDGSGHHIIYPDSPEVFSGLENLTGFYSHITKHSP